MKRPLTSVLILCWNARRLTRVTISQLLLHTTAPWELVLVDNGSTDGTGRWLRAGAAVWKKANRALADVKVISNEENRGYPAGMNQALAAASGELILIGNNDVAVTSGWLERMQDALRARPRLGGVFPFSNPPRLYEDPIRWAFPPHYRGLRALERYAAASALSGRVPPFFPMDGFFPGFWFLTTRKVLARTGPFDESYGQGGFEDLDLQWRIRADGYTLGFAGHAFVHHVNFGCAQLNGLRARDLYGPRGKRRLTRKFPGTSDVVYSNAPEFWLARAR